MKQSSDIVGHSLLLLTGPDGIPGVSFVYFSCNSISQNLALFTSKLLACNSSHISKGKCKDYFEYHYDICFYAGTLGCGKQLCVQQVQCGTLMSKSCVLNALFSCFLFIPSSVNPRTTLQNCYRISPKLQVKF